MCGTKFNTREVLRKKKKKVQAHRWISEVLKMIGGRIAGRGYQIGPTLHATAGIFNWPHGKKRQKGGSFGGKSASTQVNQQFMPELKTGNDSWKENGLMTGVSVFDTLDLHSSFSTIHPTLHWKQSSAWQTVWRGTPWNQSSEPGYCPLSINNDNKKKAFTSPESCVALLCCLPFSTSAVTEMQSSLCWSLWVYAL